jgi:alpha-1,3-rhamnosyltransferase
MNNPLVSIIVITYNSEKYVLETLESAKSQTYKNIELIITDDSSIDNTAEICRIWIEKNKARFVRTKVITVSENTGIPSNCNRGVKAAKGEWIKLIAGDDCLINTCLENYVKYVLRHPEIEVVHSDLLIYKDSFKEEFKIPSKKKILRFNDFAASPGFQFQVLLRFNPIKAPTVFIKKDVLRRLEYFDESLRLTEDRSMWLKMTQNNIKIYYLAENTIMYRLHNASVQNFESVKKIFSRAKLEREAFLVNYLIYLPFFERKIRKMEIRRKQLLDKLGFNNPSIISRIINKISGVPLIYILNCIKRKYI